MTAMTCHGLFARFPDLRILSVENGAEWVHPFLEHLEDTYKKMPQLFQGDPVEQFKHNVYVSPFHEDDFARLADVLGTEHLCMGSDYPHPEGLAEPCTFVDHLPATMSEDDKTAIMGANLARIMRVGVPVAS
jgi:predicted TIM-barrel fold metal-dependent hydrolase